MSDRGFFKQRFSFLKLKLFFFLCITIMINHKKSINWKLNQSLVFNFSWILIKNGNLNQALHCWLTVLTWFILLFYICPCLTFVTRALLTGPDRNGYQTNSVFHTKYEMICFETSVLSIMKTFDYKLIFRDI